jgi:membrane protein YdbS with pleckstrin-like domain
MLDFQNNTLDIEDLPRFEEVEGHSVASAYLKVLRIVYVFWFVVFMGGLLILHFKVNPPSLLFYPILGVLVLIFVLIIIEIEKGFQKRKFGIREKDIIFQKGFFVFKETIVPYKRIQHVEVRQGLLFKAFKLFTLKIYTAGSSTGDLSIKGLNQANSDKIKAQILKVADLDEN